VAALVPNFASQNFRGADFEIALAAVNLTPVAHQFFEDRPTFGVPEDIAGRFGVEGK